MGGGALGGKRGSTFLLVAILLVIQLATWRGRARLQVVSYEPVMEAHELAKRYSRDVGRPPSPSEEGTPNALKGKTTKKKKHDKDEKDGKNRDKKKHDAGNHSSTHTTASSTSHSSTTATTPIASSTSTPACRPLPFAATPQEVCQHVRAHCPPNGHLDYLQFFYCIGLDAAPTNVSVAMPTRAPVLTHNETFDIVDDNSLSKIQSAGLTTRVKVLRIFALALVIAWMLFLFSWVGIVASDFFCPNLGTLSARLGLSESTAGVTFLAFGNGSPDVFSTFGAMRTGSGSLAIGELIGAASFIVSVISGSMMLIAPFRVKRYPFLRDVGFFTVAVSMTMAFLLDGKLRFGECLSMIALYLAYAATIIIGSWWQERRRLQQARLANIRSEHSVSSVAMYDDGGEAGGASTGGTAFSPQHHSPMIAPMSAIEYEPDVDPFARWAAQQDAIETEASSHSGISPSHSPLLLPADLPSTGSANNARLQRFRNGIMARHSLLGAVEFRDVVQSLRKETSTSTDRSMDIYQSRDPERYLPHPHLAHQHHLHPSDASATAQRHARTKSLTRSRTSRFASQCSPDLRATLTRSRSTIGTSAEAGSMTDISRPTLEQVGQSSGLAAVAAAVGNPWRENGMESALDIAPLPPPVIPVENVLGRSRSEDDLQVYDAFGPGLGSVSQPKPTLPRLNIRRATMPSQDDESFARRKKRHSLRGASATPSDSSSNWEGFRRRIKPTIRLLFPSLRHFRNKSWLGTVIGFVTAPAILVLKLTLPVVDDEADSALPSNQKTVRLEGEEAALTARPQPGGVLADASDEEEDDDDVDTGRNIINLSGTRLDVDNPWEASPNGVATDDQTPNDNKRKQLQIASTLRRLPEDASPLLSPGPQHQVDVKPSPRTAPRCDRHRDVDATSLSSQGSCRSADSHVESATSHTFLIVAQCALAPPFCVWAVTSSAHSKHVGEKTALALLFGLTVSAVVLFGVVRARRAAHSLYPSSVLSACGWARVGLGFFVSILYIMTIVDEVVSILQTLGLVLGLSDAILGLTVFAMGNSLGDLVANITIAKMGHPIMAISACFAGPLLNLLLGIGISGSWLLSRHHVDDNQPVSLFGSHHWMGDEPGIYHIDFSPTLVVSGFGLLVILIGTLIAVPLNGYYLNRAIGMTLIITYAVIMSVNIGVEIYNLNELGGPV